MVEVKETRILNTNYTNCFAMRFANFKHGTSETFETCYTTVLSFGAPASPSLLKMVILLLELAISIWR